MSKILGLYVDDRILDYAISNDLIIFGLEAAKYSNIQQLASGIRESIQETFGTVSDDEDRPLIQPTHTDYKTMIRDMCKVLNEHPDCEIIPCDDPRSLVVGYVIFWMVNGEEESVSFFIHITDLKELPLPLKQIVMTKEGRDTLCNKEILRNIAQ